MQKLKKSILIIFILVIIIMLVMLFINIKKQDKPIQSNDKEIENTANKERVTEDIEFYSVKECINKFINLSNINNSNYYDIDETGKKIKVIQENEVKQNIYQLLSDKYIKNNNITIDNVFDFIDKFDKQMIFIPTDMYVLRGKNENKYLISGCIEDMGYNKNKDIYMFVNMDNIHNTFSVELMNKENANIDEIPIENEDVEISENENNQYVEPTITDEYIVDQCFNSYKSLILGDSETLYNEYLNDNYKKERFGNYDNFKVFVENKTKEIIKSDVEKYLNSDTDGYICIDNLNNYYVIEREGPLDYKICLDLYTIDLQQFLNKYNAASDQEKVVLNINKIVSAINNKDYNYVYKKLADSFKNNYFKDEESLREYLQNNLYDKIVVEYNEFEREGNIYTYKIRVIKQYGEGEEIPEESNAPSKNMNIVMKLNEGTDFVMSFSLEE